MGNMVALRDRLCDRIERTRAERYATLRLSVSGGVEPCPSQAQLKQRQLAESVRAPLSVAPPVLSWNRARSLLQPSAP